MFFLNFPNSIFKRADFNFDEIEFVNIFFYKSAFNAIHKFPYESCFIPQILICPHLHSADNIFNFPFDFFYNLLAIWKCII